MIQTIPQVNQTLILAGRRWIIERVDEKGRNIYVARIKTGGAISFASQVPELDEIFTRKMREIYLSREIYPYVDAASNSHLELIETREFFNKSKLDMNFFTGSTLFTWAGTKVNRTIALICKLRLQKSPEYNYIYVGGIYFNDIAKIMSQPKPTAEELAALVPRSSKEKQKFDKYLSDHLMNIEYASTYLNVDKAWHELKQQALSGGYKEPETIVKPKINKEGTKMEKYDFRHIQDISNVWNYNTLSDGLNKTFSEYLENEGYQIEIGARFPNAPEHAMPINFLLSKGDKKVAILLMGMRKTKRYSVQETEALCKENGVDVLKFYFEKENERDYVVERIRKAFN